MGGSRSKAWLKGCSLGCGFLALLIALGALWISHAIRSQAGPLEITDHHPFRSPAAKERFLARYDNRGEAWPVPAETRMAETSWGQTFVRISGPAEARPLVLLPGAGGSSLQWIPNVASLSKSRRVYAVDNIYDIGRSIYTRRLTSADDFVDWLDELLTSLELEDDVSLMGLSYGGWIAGQYALRHPERLDRVVLAAPAGTVLNLSAGFIKRALLAVIPHRSFSRNLIHWLAEDSLGADEATRRELEASIEDGYLGLRSFAFKQMVPPHVLSDKDLSSFDVPVLFLVGENEKIYPASAAVERLNRVSPQVETEVIGGAGHDLTLVRAELVNERVLAFLERSDTPPGELPGALPDERPGAGATTEH